MKKGDKHTIPVGVQHQKYPTNLEFREEVKLIIKKSMAKNDHRTEQGSRKIKEDVNSIVKEKSYRFKEWIPSDEDGDGGGGRWQLVEDRERLKMIIDSEIKTLRNSLVKSRSNEQTDPSVLQ